MFNGARIKYCDTTPEKSVDNREHKAYPKRRRNHYYSPEAAKSGVLKIENLSSPLGYGRCYAV